MYDEEFDRMSPDLSNGLKGLSITLIRKSVDRTSPICEIAIKRRAGYHAGYNPRGYIDHCKSLVSRRHVTFDPVPLRLAARPVNLQ